MFLSRTLASLNACRLHGEGCHVTWGYDRAHTDSRRPYTTEELAEREAAPHRYAYPAVQAYERGFRLWRALRRDAQPTYLERITATAVQLAPLTRRLQMQRRHADPLCPTARALEGLEGVPDGFDLAVAELCGCSFESFAKGFAPPAGSLVTAQSANVHGDPPAPCGPVVGPGRNATHRAVPNRIDTDPHAPAAGGYPHA
ncbi:hypothetical protein HCJ76_43935 [Streptomyces sp. MC1]|uniref:hypothetical protein n=1 Tax=Streptomyces sp. MC1 TaxID=295105 RepID=UPI0018C9D03B|nr:hypothetical protein [Streptomyces sp. MC1]MBG7704834.1 hypothetical protein [Streptomyces sp. MC1]